MVEREADHWTTFSSKPGRPKMARFDDHLGRWKESGEFPAIHNAIAQVILSEVEGQRMVDLGACHGLLAARVMRFRPASLVMAVESDAVMIQAAGEFGVPVQFTRMHVLPDFTPLCRFIRDWRMTVLIARRVLPEILGVRPHDGQFARAIASAGITEVVVQGRAVSGTPSNRLASVSDEVVELSGPFREVLRVGQVSYLRAHSWPA